MSKSDNKNKKSWQQRLYEFADQRNSVDIDSLISSYVKFKHQDKTVYKFNVWHNLPEVWSLSLKDAVQQWVNRTSIFTAESLCEYIMFKRTGYVCYTEEQYLNMCKEKRITPKIIV